MSASEPERRNDLYAWIDSAAPELLRADDDDPRRWRMSRAAVPEGYLCTFAVEKQVTGHR